MPLLGKKIAHYIFFWKKIYIDGHLLKKKKDEHKNPKQTRIKIYIKKKIEEVTEEKKKTRTFSWRKNWRTEEVHIW